MCAGWNLVPGPCVDAGKTYRKMARLHAEQHLLKLLQTEAVTFRDVLQMCYLWSDVPLTANLWSQLACCCSPLWWLSKRVIEEYGCSAEIFCPGFVRQSADDEEMLLEAFHLRHRRSRQCTAASNSRTASGRYRPGDTAGAACPF